MHQQRNSRSFIRPDWITDLSTALIDAERLLSILEADGQFPSETTQLRLRVETVRSEMELLGQMTRRGDRVIRTPWPDQTPTGSSPPPENGSMNGPMAGASQPAVAQKPRLRNAVLP